jgi:GGDEF domain-containing protein
MLIRKTQKKKHETPQEAQTAALETLELKRQVDEYLMGQVTLTEQTLKDPYSGLFRMSYFKDRIDEEISRQNNFGQVFSVVLLKFKDISAITMKLLKDAADMVQEDFNKDCICCYDGNGTFEVLLPKHTQDDIQIFAESAAEHLERITRREFDTEVIQYGTIKHSEFMEKVCRQ